MSNYTQATFFAPKDALSPGDPLKTVKGADIDPEFSAISTAIATKVDTATAQGGLVKSGTGLALDFTNLTVLSGSVDPTVDRVAIYDSSAGAMRYVLAAFLDINSLTQDTSPDVNADFVATYDTSAAANKKVLLSLLSPKPFMLTSQFTFTNQGTLQTVLTIPVTTGQTYMLEWDAIVESTTAGYTITMNVPGTGNTSGSLTWEGTKASPPQDPAATVIANGADSTILTEAAGSAKGTAFRSCWYLAPTSSGNVVIKVKQNTADSNASYIGQGGFARLSRLT